MKRFNLNYVYESVLFMKLWWEFFKYNFVHIRKVIECKIQLQMIEIQKILITILLANTSFTSTHKITISAFDLIWLFPAEPLNYYLSVLNILTKFYNVAKLEHLCKEATPVQVIHLAAVGERMLSLVDIREHVFLRESNVLHFQCKWIGITWTRRFYRSSDWKKFTNTWSYGKTMQ